MGIAVILGYLSSAFFIFCGVVNVVDYLKHSQQITNYAEFLNGMALEGWTFAVGTALYLLTQIALQCEKQAIVQNLSLPPIPAPIKKEQPSESTKTIHQA